MLVRPRRSPLILDFVLVLMFRYADIGHSQRVLGYKPTTSIETGLKKFAEWYLASERKDQIEGFANDGEWNAK